MTEAGRDLRYEVEKSAALLRSLRDQVRRRVHLHGVEAKEAWDELEPTLEAALERAARDASEGSHAALVELTEAHRRLREWRR